MKLSDDAVKVSVVSFGESANLEILEGKYDSIYSLDNMTSNLQKVSGSYRLDLAFELAYKLTQRISRKGDRHVVLFVTQANYVTQANHIGYNTEVVETKAKSMKYSGVDLFTILINQANEPVDEYIYFVSSPVEKHLFEVKQSQDLSNWPTVTARAVCRNVS